ncbi:MAG TPA: DUF6496 domain-containing protein [Edaphocola sp.]|nr:DUF6496 domain-containing protein [Edaphocola sp.]
MAKYSKKAQEKVEKALHEMKEGKLKSSSGEKVTSREQAIAIGLSEAREEGAKVPKKRDESSDDPSEKSDESKRKKSKKPSDK